MFETHERKLQVLWLFAGNGRGSILAGCAEDHADSLRTGRTGLTGIISDRGSLGDHVAYRGAAAAIEPISSDAEVSG